MRAPDGAGRLFRTEQESRMRKGRDTKPVRTKSCRVVTNEVGGRCASHTSSEVPLRRAAISGDRGALTSSGDVSRLWRSGRQHATYAFVTAQARR